MLKKTKKLESKIKFGLDYWIKIALFLLYIIAGIVFVFKYEAEINFPISSLFIHYLSDKLISIFLGSIIGCLLFFLIRFLIQYILKLIRTFRIYPPLFQHYFFITIFLGILFICHNIWHCCKVRIVKFQMFFLFIVVTIFVVIILSVIFYLNKNKEKEKNKIFKGYSKMFFSDVPITSSKDDIIGFSEIVDVIDEEANKFLNGNFPKFFSIVGEWGSGKTSFLNLIKERLLNISNKSNKNRKYIYFNIAEYNEIESVHLYFYKQIIDFIKEKYVLPVQFNYQFFKSLNAILEKDIRTGFLSFLFPVKDFGIYLDELSQILIKMNIILVIGMDDLDRLKASEINEVFRLIRIIKVKMKNIILLVATDMSALENYKYFFNECSCEKGEVEIEKNVSDLTDKYFDETILLPNFQRAQLPDLFFKEILNILAEKQDNKNTVDMIREKLEVLKKFAYQYLTTMRKLKKTLNVFKEDFARLEFDIYLPDLILMSVIKSTNIELMSTIKKNRHFLTYDILNDDEKYRITRSIPEIAMQKIKEIQEFVNQNIDIEYKEIFFELFPNCKLLYEYKEGGSYLNDSKVLNNNLYNIEQEIFENDRIANPLLLDKYFHSLNPEQSVEIITSKKHKNNILKSAKDSKNIDKTIELLRPLLNPDLPGTYIELSFDWIDRTVRTFNNDTVAYNLVISVAILVKRLPYIYISGWLIHYRASNLLFNYLRRDNSSVNILFDVIKNLETSDKFSEVIVFNLVKHESVFKDMDINTKISILNSFLQRIKSKIYSETGELQNIFDKDISDFPNDLLIAWKYAEEYLKKINKTTPLDITSSEYIFNLSKKDLKFFENFMDQFSKDKDSAYLKDIYKKNFEYMLIPEKAAELYEYYKKTGLLKKIENKNVLNTFNWWYENYKNQEGTNEEV